MSAAAATAVATVQRPVPSLMAVAAAPRAVPAVTSLTLINADTDQPVAGFAPIANGATIDLSALPTRRLNVRANVGTGAASVKFGYDANPSYRIESGAPYALASNNGPDYFAWTPAVGAHTLKATAYPQAGAKGTAGPTLTVGFKVVSGPALPAVSVVATDAAAAEAIGDGGVVDTGTLTVSRTGPTTSPLTVNLTLAGTAVEGSDYGPIARTVTIPAGATWTTVSVAATDDDLAEPSESVVVRLASGAGYTITSAQASAAVAIADDDTPVPPPPPPVTEVTVGQAGTTGLTVSWPAADPADPSAPTEYRVRYAPGEYLPGAAGEPRTVTVLAPQTSVTLAGLNPFTFYGIDVTAVRDDGPVANTHVNAYTARPATTKRYLYTFHLPKAKDGFRTLKPHIEVYDVANGNAWVRNVPLPAGIYNVRGVAASTVTNRLYVSYFKTAVDGYQTGGLLSLNLSTGAVIYKRDYPASVVGSPDRFDLTPDGKTIYMPVGEHGVQGEWVVLDAATGNKVKSIPHVSASHNTIVSLDGRLAFLEGQEKGSDPPEWKHTVGLVDTATNTIVKRVGPFRDVVRPFTVNGDASLIFATTNNWVGFEVADVATNTVLRTVAPPGYAQPDPGRNASHSHGIALTPDEKKLFVVDTTKVGIHVFDVSKVRTQAPTYLGFIQTRRSGRNLAGQYIPEASNDAKGVPAWLGMSYDGKYLYAENGEVIDVATLKIVGQLRAKTTDGSGNLVWDKYSHSRFMVEVDVDTTTGRAVKVTKQFATGRVR